LLLPSLLALPFAVRIPARGEQQSSHIVRPEDAMRTIARTGARPQYIPPHHIIIIVHLLLCHDEIGEKKPAGVDPTPGQWDSQSVVK
jgi:hypothetical protein